MAWPPPTHGGAESLHQLIAQQAFLNNNGGASSTNPGGHAPITNDEIESEYEFNTQFGEPSRVFVASDFDVEPGVGGSNSGYGAPRVHGQSPQPGASGGGSSGGSTGAVPPSKTTLDARRSLQARGKNYHTGSGELQGREWEDRQRRDEAVSILESEEMIMWIAGVRNEVCLFLSTYPTNLVLIIHVDVVDCMLIQSCMT
jgi:hypothetical protein